MLSFQLAHVIVYSVFRAERKIFTSAFGSQPRVILTRLCCITRGREGSNGDCLGSGTVPTIDVYFILTHIYCDLVGHWGSAIETFYFHCRYVYDLAQEYLVRVEEGERTLEYTYTTDGAVNAVMLPDGRRDQYHWEHTGESHQTE